MFLSKVIHRGIRKSSGYFRSYSDDLNPFARTWKLISNEVPEFFGLRKKATIYPTHVDIVIIGGGYMGSATAHALKTRAGIGLSVVVLEKDLTYKEARNNISHGTLIRNCSLPENIELATYGAEFLRNSKENLGEDVDIQYIPNGFLMLASERYAEKMEQTATQQREMGLKNEILSSSEIKERFPWINTSDVKLGSMCLETEGVFNSWSFLRGLVKKSQELGAIYINAEVTGFEILQQRDVLMEGIEPGSFQRINKVVYKTPDNEEHSIKFAACVLAAGSHSGEIAKLAKIGVSDGLLKIPLPIEERKYGIYSIEGGASSIGLNTPLIMDTSGVWLRRNGLDNNLLCGHVPFTSEETKNFSEEEFYKTMIEPALNNRYPMVEAKKVRMLTSELQDYNTYDESGILGPHAYHNNLYIAAGFGKYGCQHAPGIGRAIAELIIDSHYTTIDLTRLGFDRILIDEPLIEFDVY